MRILGLRPDEVAGAVVVAAGAVFCACASALEVSVAAATSVDVPSSMLRRLRVLSSVGVAFPLCLVSSGIFGSFFTLRTDNYSVASVLLTQRNPTWLVEVSIGSAWRA